MTYPVLCGAVEITAANNAIRIVEGATTSTATIAAGTYYLRGDGSSVDLLLAIKTAMQNATGASTNTYNLTVTHSLSTSTFHTAVSVSRATGADSFQIKWADAATTFDAALLGFEINTTLGAGPFTSTICCAASWVSNDAFEFFEPFSTKIVAVERATNARVSGIERSSRMQSYAVALNFVDEGRCFIDHATLGESEAFEAFLDRFGAGAVLEVHDSEVSSGATLQAISSSTLLCSAHFAEDILGDFRPSRVGPGIPLYGFSFDLHAEVE